MHSGSKLENSFFNWDPKLVSLEQFDYVVVGAGFAGGLLAATLANKKKKVLLLERGRLLFSTHCLNTSRQHANYTECKGPSQDNDLIYRCSLRLCCRGTRCCALSRAGLQRHSLQCSFPCKVDFRS